MAQYTTEILELANNPNYTYYKLYVDGKCDFETFYEEIAKNVSDMKSMAAIIAYMDSLSAQILPGTIYNYIHDSRRKDLYEFKKKNLRVYVIDQRPNIYVVMGGYKGNQKKDIAKLKERVREFPQEEKT